MNKTSNWIFGFFSAVAAGSSDVITATPPAALPDSSAGSVATASERLWHGHNQNQTSIVSLSACPFSFMGTRLIQSILLSVATNRIFKLFCFFR
jgi:hypothetical protein